MTTLVVGPNWVGDMVMAHTLIGYLRSKRSDEPIHLLSPQWSLSVAERMPEVDRLIESPFVHGQLDLLNRRKFAKEVIAPENYRRVFVLPNSWKSALVPFFARIPRRIGWRGEWRNGLLTDCRILKPKYFPRLIDQYFALAFPANIAFSSFSLPQEAIAPCLVFNERNRESWIVKRKIDKNKCVVLCPGAEFGPSKCWPVVKFSELADKLVNLGSQIVILGSKNDEERGKQLVENISAENRSRVINLVGETSIPDAIDILSLADIVVTNDSGLMHLAAALNLKLLALYGSSSPLKTPPISNNAIIVTNNVPCQPCFERECPLEHHNCLTGLSVEKVMEKFFVLSNRSS